MAVKLPSMLLIRKLEIFLLKIFKEASVNRLNINVGNLSRRISRVEQAHQVIEILQDCCCEIKS
ncbi:MAG: hypothetical protein ACJAW3_001252 [Lentimonas sp.]|jgi:hypothetical protein